MQAYGLLSIPDVPYPQVHCPIPIKISNYPLSIFFWIRLWCRTYGVSDLWGVGLMGCRTYDIDPFSNTLRVAWLTMISLTLILEWLI